MSTIKDAAYVGDIVSRLRNWRGLHLAHGGELFEEAADEIEGLRAATGHRQQEITDDMPRWNNLTLLQQLRDKGQAMKCVPMFAVKAMRHAASIIESHQQHDAELETACHQSELDYQAEIERLRLTDKEKEAIKTAIADDDAATHFNRADVLRRLLERTQ